MNQMFFFPLQIDTQCSGTQPENITVTLKNDESLETAMLYSFPIRKHSIHYGNLLSISKTNTVALVTVNFSDYLTFSNHYTAVIGLVNKGGASESNFTISMCQRSSNSALFSLSYTSIAYLALCAIDSLLIIILLPSQF